ncbi:MAG: hypothetical protein KF764_25400 [Labilithrix sp.]|nr:hypothetical protein [Labilithrix sp.]
MVSQATAPAVLGITPKKFIEIVKQWGIPHTRCGRSYLVRLDTIVDAIEKHGVELGAPTNDLHASGEASDVDAWLAKMGERRTAER